MGKILAAAAQAAPMAVDTAAPTLMSCRSQPIPSQLREFKVALSGTRARRAQP